VPKTTASPVAPAQVSAEKPSAPAEKKSKKTKEKKQKPEAPSTTTSTEITPSTSQTKPMEAPLVPDVPAPPARPLPDVATTTIPKEKNKNEAWYLRTVASQYATDLDKLRTAPDFKGKESVEVLRWAMRLGVECLDV
jgi:ribosome assembly protein 3